MTGYLQELQVAVHKANREELIEALNICEGRRWLRAMWDPIKKDFEGDMIYFNLTKDLKFHPEEADWE